MGLLNSKKADNIPAYYSYQDTKDLINRINLISKQNQRDLGMLFILAASELKYDHQNWKKSIMPGILIIYKNGNRHKFEIILNVKQAYQMHEHLRHFIKNSDTTNLTPSILQPEQDKVCCICTEQIANMMLSCSHVFCYKCTQNYIINKQEKKCPLCRTQFKCEKQDLEKAIFTVYHEEELINTQLKQVILNILRQLNSRQIQNIESVLKNKTGEMHEK